MYMQETPELQYPSLQLFLLYLNVTDDYQAFTFELQIDFWTFLRIDDQKETILL